MKTNVFCICLLLCSVLVYAFNRTPLYFTGVVEVLEANNAEIGSDNLKINNQIVAQFGERIKGVMVYKIKAKDQSIRIDIKKSPKSERIEIDFSTIPVKIDKFEKVEGVWKPLIALSNDKQ